ncbi:MAG: nucleotidyltransferase family protein [Lachnospiraceae bacterium]|nr:nucleotidyltransferase family protein [Lachnospiraceae bacterium]
MKIASVIAEFNPFHNGHAHLVQKTKEECGADYVVAFMSGDFVQRGAPAICDKFTRAEAAVKCGVDAVFELPVVYATGAAPDFAFGGVSMAENMGCCDFLAFGSECGDLDTLQKAAILISEETEEFKEKLMTALKKGLSYPAAISSVVSKTLKADENPLRAPNNTLGIEYLKALKLLNSKITPFTIQRHLSSYHENGLVTDKETGISYTGATYLRNVLTGSEETETLRRSMPEEAFETIFSEFKKSFPVVPDDFTLPLSLMLEKMTAEEVDSLTGNIDSKSKLKKNLLTFEKFTSLRSDLHDKSLTESAAGRLLTHALLGIYDKDVDRETGVKYLRLLAMNKDASPLLKKIKETSSIPLITKMADFDISKYPMLMKDVYASNLYQKVVSEKFGLPYKNDIIHSPVIV